MNTSHSLPKKTEKAKEIALVLSSGGARGLAHIGAIEVLLENGYRIAAISGSSMGALIGGLYATGKLQEYKEWVTSLDKLDMLSLIDFTITTRGIIKGEKVFDKMKRMGFLPDIAIEELDIPFKAIAVDILNNREVVFESGNLNHAIRASISIPGVFTPTRHRQSLLVDGGVLTPLPLEHVARKTDDLLVAIDLNAQIPYEKPNEYRELPPQKPRSEKHLSLLQKWDELFGHNHTHPVKKTEKPNRPSISYFDLATRSIQLMQSQLSRYAMEIRPPDITISISKGASTVFEFYRAKELIEYGRQQCKKALGL